MNKFLKFTFLIAVAFMVLPPICSVYAKSQSNIDQIVEDENTPYPRLRGQLPSPLIYNGEKSIDGEFPAMGWIGNCTGTLVAPDVIFTASHCATTGKRISFKHRGTGKSVAATCTRHPEYNNRTVYNDWAFCKLDSPLEGQVMASFLLESPKVDEKLLLNGFGAPHVQVHYWGEAPVDHISGQDIYTCGPANLGGGDSGGSLLKWTDDRSGKSGFEIYGVNSRGGGGCSLFNRTSHENFKSFAKQYEKDKSVSICGISRKCQGGGEPVDPRLCLSIYYELGNCIGDASKECQSLYSRFASCLTPMTE